MATVRYTTVNGEVIAEKRNGVRSLYVPDALGSTVALLDNTQTKSDTFEYRPYGEVRTRTGTTTTPLQFVGTTGYYKDSTTKTYVRSRTADLLVGRWMTEDPTPLTNGHMFDSVVSEYAYCDNQLVAMIDPAGEKPHKPPRIVIGAQPFDPFWWNQDNRRGSQNCYSYACNQPFPHSTGNPFPQPGGGVTNACSCKSVEEAVAKGGSPSLLAPGRVMGDSADRLKNLFSPTRMKKKSVRFLRNG